MQRAVDDVDLKATPAVTDLYDKGFDEHYLTKIFSLGNLGVKTERKIVPTRWSITAVDDQLGKKLIEDVRYYNEMDYNAYFVSHLGNYFIVLTFPGAFSYELFEMSTKSYEFMTDYENHTGRKQYAHITAGGYYASRLAVLEHFKKIKKKAQVLVLRLITDEYWAPLGVWVVREAVRKAMENKPIQFSSKELMIEYTKKLAHKKFTYDIEKITKHSKILKNLKEQTRLFDFKFNRG